MHHCRSGHIGHGLRIALRWWLAVLSLNLEEHHEWIDGGGDVAYLFADAAGAPARLACVLVVDGACYWTDGPPSARTMDRFAKRNDNQIMSLEVNVQLGPVVGMVCVLPGWR